MHNNQPKYILQKEKLSKNPTQFILQDKMTMEEFSFDSFDEKETGEWLRHIRLLCPTGTSHTRKNSTGMLVEGRCSVPFFNL